MESSLIIPIIVGAIALVIGIVAGKLLFAGNTRKKLEEAESLAQKIVSDAQVNAENLKKEKLLEAKEKFVQLKQSMIKKCWKGTAN